MPSLLEEVDQLIEDQSSLDAAKAGAKGDDRKPEGEESEELQLLRQIRDIVRHIAGDDLPADLAGGVEPQAEPGIPTDAAEARDQS